MSKAKYLWMRTGDNAEYEMQDSPYHAGEQVGFLSPSDFDVRWRNTGVEVGGFTGYNYISLFWGDDDAQPVGKADLTKTQRAEFVRGLYEGAEEPMPMKKTKRKTAKSRSKSSQTSLGGMRG